VSQLSMLLGVPPSMLLDYRGPASWVFDIVLLNLGIMEERIGSVAERVRRRRNRRLSQDQRRRLYVG